MGDDDYSSCAPYLRLAADLRQRIARGEFKVGDRLPSNRALAERYGVAVLTAQKAVHALRDEGLIDTQPGLGVFVREPGKDQPAGPATYDDIIRSLEAVHEDVRNIARRLDDLEATAPRRPGDDSAHPGDTPGSEAPSSDETT